MNIINISVNNIVNKYLDEFCERFDINYHEWYKCNYEYFCNDVEDAFDELIGDVAILIGNMIYEEGNYKIYYDDDKNVKYILHVIENNGIDSNLISWKYCNQYNNIVLRYGVYGLERYIGLRIDINKFWSQTNYNRFRRTTEFLPISHFLNR